ncbi:hypothetical protein EB093_04640 [bacterium]|nr:hypothetical protein [bacterium]
MNKRMRRVFFLYLPAILLMGGAVKFCVNRSHTPASTPSVTSPSHELDVVNVQTDHLKPLTTIENALKIEVGVNKIDEREVVFHVLMESFQNTDAVQSDILDTTILTVDGRPYKPSKWKEKEQDDNHKEGYLTFKIDRRPSTIKLSIFELEERVFEWSLVPTESSKASSH